MLFPFCFSEAKRGKKNEAVRYLHSLVYCIWKNIRLELERYSEREERVAASRSYLGIEAEVIRNEVANATNELIDKAVILYLVELFTLNFRSIRIPVGDTSAETSVSIQSRHEAIVHSTASSEVDTLSLELAIYAANGVILRAETEAELAAYCDSALAVDHIIEDSEFGISSDTTLKHASRAPVAVEMAHRIERIEEEIAFFEFSLLCERSRKERESPDEGNY